MSKLIYLRIDTTGTDLTKDRIIAIHARKVTPEGKTDFDRYILPKGNWSIDPDASEVNGLTDDYIRQHGEDPVTVFNDFNAFVSDKDTIDFVTFGGLNFDLRFLNIAYMRHGLYFDAIHKRIFDMRDIEQRNNRNDFVSTYSRHCGKEISSKTIDAMEELFWKMSDDYTPEQILGDYKPVILDLENLYRQDNTGRLKFVRGKHEGEYVYDVIRKDPDYMYFLFKDILSAPSRQIVINEYESLKKASEVEVIK